MQAGEIVNISDYHSEFYCRTGEVLKVTNTEVLVMFLIRETERVIGVSCIVESFKKDKVYKLKKKKTLKLLRGLDNAI